MTLDWDGRIRMDPSSPYAMRRLVGLKDKYDIAFSCDTDHDRHGIVAPSTGLMPPNHFLAVAIDYLFRHRPGWGARRRRRQDGGQQRHDRPGGGAAGTPALRGAGRLQVVRRRPVRRRAGLRRRGERRRLLPAPRRHGVDDRQGRHRRRPAGRRDHRPHRPRSRPALPRPGARAWRHGRRSRRRAGDGRAEEAGWASCRRQR